MLIRIKRIYCYLYSLLCMLCLLLIVSSPSARADGGAPQLAYVAGGGQGVSVIDIAQRRVTRTMALAGKPRTVLLSLDGHALYVAQPAIGRVSIIAAKTEQTICPASHHLWRSVWMPAYCMWAARAIRACARLTPQPAKSNAASRPTNRFTGWR